MNFLEKLLDGVAVNFLPLGDVTNYEQPTKYLVAAKNYSDDFDTPVLTAGKTFILGYTDESEGIYRAFKHPVIIFDDFTTANKWVDFDFKVKSSAMKMITSKDNNKFLLKYIYYWLNTLPNELIDGDHKRQWIGNYSNKLIPIPCPDNPQKSLEIQAEIVRILDAMTAHTAELTAELTARKKQYRHYLDKAFDFSTAKEINNSTTIFAWRKLEDLCTIGDGLHGTPEYDNDGKYFFINGNNLSNGYLKFNKNTKKVNFSIYKKYGIDFNPENTLFLSINGTIGNISFFKNEKIVLGKSVAYFNKTSDDLNLRYLFYFFKTSYSSRYFEIEKTGSTIKNLGLRSLRAMKIPLPSLEVQNRVVSMLDKFDALTASITEGLPREIELREKQYAYYRDLLLSFPQAQAA